MGYKLTIHFSDGSSEEIDEIFETEQNALDVYDSWLDSWGSGRESLKLAGRSGFNTSIEAYDIDEV